ncbi:MAG: hypothetical protein ABIR34_10310 [Marmoricola sp.]
MLPAVDLDRELAGHEPADAGDALLAIKSLQGITHHVMREALAAFVGDRPPVFRGR